MCSVTSRAHLAPVPERVPPQVPPVHHLDTHRRATRSPLFKAALALLAGHDRLGILMCLCDAYPRENIRDLDQALREMAVMFAAAGLFPKAGT